MNPLGVCPERPDGSANSGRLTTPPVGTTLGTADADIDAYEAWNGGSTTDWKAGTTGSAAVPIAVLDTGINENHEDLKGKVTKRINFACTILAHSPCPNSTASDVYGHGTPRRRKRSCPYR